MPLQRFIAVYHAIEARELICRRNFRGRTRFRSRNRVIGNEPKPCETAGRSATHGEQGRRFFFSPLPSVRAILRATDEIVIFSVIPFPSNTWWQVIVANSFNRGRSTVFINSELIQHRSRIGPDFARLFPERDRGRRAEECRKICFFWGGGRDWRDRWQMFLMQVQRLAAITGVPVHKYYVASPAFLSFFPSFLPFLLTMFSPVKLSFINRD